MVFSFSLVQAQVKSEDDLKKQAEKDFESEEYNSAYKLYAQLVSLYPKDPEYNYRLGVCMLFTEPDKKKPYSYLQIATKNPNEAPKDAKFYLAKTYHMNYRFDEALKLYNEYKQIASSSSLKKLQVDREIEACKNGKRLLSNLSDLVVINKKQLNEADYFRSYELKDIGGKLLVKPEDFKSSADKKKKDKSVVYLPKTGERVYYSSYGESGDRGRDIYYVNKLPNGTWSKPTAMPVPINTEYDEDYPFLHPNGKILYFSSKGHNSMGGYDVFKTTFDDQTNTWSKPVNMDFPINSPDDDILFVTDSLEKTAFFSTGRYSPYGKIDVLKINTERRPMNFAVLKGTVLKESADQSLKSKITVKNMDNGEIVGTYQAGDNGDYYMELPNGGKFLFTVETPGIETQSDAVQMPVAYTLKPYKQAITYENKKLKIVNYFDGDVSDENYAMMIDLIEKKAHLEINEMEPYNNGLKDAAIKNNDNANANNLNAVNTTNPTVSANNDNNANNNKNVTNEQLLSIAKEDAKEASNEATQLKQEAQDAFGLATQKTDEAAQKQKAADEVMTNANALTDINQKNEELAKANQLQEEAKVASSIATTATNLAKKLEVDANQKQKEADLTNQYIQEIDAVIKNKNNKEALAKLEQIQKELDDLSKQKNQSDELYNSLKAELDLKKNELQKTEAKNNSIVTEINNIKNETKVLETDLANESDKSLKENIAAQIRELNSDIDLRNKELEANNQKANNLTKEVNGLNKEIEIAGNILNDKGTDVAVNNANNSNANNNVTNDNANVSNNNVAVNNTNTQGNLSYEGVSQKYNDEIKSIATDNTSKDGYEKQNEVLKKYNKEVTDLIALDKNQLAKTKDANEKKKLTQEIKNLETQKTQNDKLLAANNAKIKEVEASTIAANNAVNNNAANNNNNEVNNNAANNNANNNAVVTNTVNEVNNAVIENNNAANTNSVAVTNNNSDVNNNAANNNAVSNNVANNNVVNNNAENNNNVAAVNTTNPTAGNKDVVTPINISNNADKNTVTNELNNLNTVLANNTSKEETVFAYNDYKEGSSNTLKQEASTKIELAKQKEQELKQLIEQSKNNINTSAGGSSTTLVNEAEDLNAKAMQLRKEASTKTGTEKDALVKEAIQNDKLAVTKKLEASVLQQNQNKANFDNNANNLTELQKLSANKTSDEISQANMLTDEAALNFKQAQKLRDEANAYPTDGAKLGGLSNAEEKENEALLKQQKALDVLAKNNPDYKLKTIEQGQGSDVTSTVAKLNTEIENTNKAQLDAYLAVSNANQNELKLQNDKISNSTAFQTTNDTRVKNLKTVSDELAKEAQSLIAQANNTTTTPEKANLLLQANNNEVEALKALNQANEILNAATVVNNNANNNANEVTNNAVNTNTVSANNNAGNEVVTNNNNTDNNNANNAAASRTVDPNNNVNNNVTDNNNANANNNVAVNNNAVETNTVNPNNANSTNPTNTNSITTNETSAITANETKVANFNEYSSSEAVSLKENGQAKLNSALNEEKSILAEIETLSKVTTSNGTGAMSVQTSQQNITNLQTEADKLSNDAFDLRKSAATKTSTEKENDLNEAKKLEQQSVAKKVEAANQQQVLNKAVYEANQQSLDDLAKMAVGKNIAELNNAQQQVDEANLNFKQASNLRTEANSLPTDGAKLGGYSNAEEKENTAIVKQKALLDVYKKYFSNYELKTPVITSSSDDTAAKLAEANNKLNQNNQQQIEGLNLLAQANDKEYSARVAGLPASLNENQNVFKTKAEETYKQSQDLNTQANQATDIRQKKKLLVESNQQGQLAISLLNQINQPNIVSSENPVTNNNNVNNTTNPNANNVANNNTVRNNAAANNANTSNANTVKLKVEGLEIKTGNAYTANKPIPIDEKIPDGLVFKVQIGAFKAPLPNNTFKGLSPIIAQTTPNGYIRYMAGNFDKFESANAVKNDLRNLGYSDAFVVGYYNGKRITLTEALDKLKEQGQPVDLAANNNTSAGLTANNNVPRNVITPAATNNQVVDTQPVEVTKELEKMNGLLYTVQIGVFSKQVTKSQLYNLKPIYTEKLPNGLYRYTAGIYNQSSKLLDDKRKVVDLGVKDAFVSAYYNAKRVPFTEGQKLQTENSNLQMESENPIVFPGSSSVPVNNVANTNVTNATQPAVTPFNNGVATGPAPTADNGVKTDDAGISYKVQIGAYKNQVPTEVAAKFLNIKTWPVNYVTINGLYIYTIGNFNAASFAKKLRDEAVAVGITDAFITVYKDGKKLYGAEATQYLSN